MSRVSLRENCLIGFGVTLFFSVVLAGLSINIVLDGWKQVTDLLITLTAFNIATCIYVAWINRPTFLFYLREVVVCFVLALISNYIWVVLALSAGVLIFSICLSLVLVCYVVIFYLYKKSQRGAEFEGNIKGVRWIGLAGALGASSQIVSNENGVLLLVAISTSIAFCLMAAVYFRLAIKRDWGKAKGAWNEV